MDDSDEDMPEINIIETQDSITSEEESDDEPDEPEPVKEDIKIDDMFVSAEVKIDDDIKKLKVRPLKSTSNDLIETLKDNIKNTEPLPNTRRQKQLEHLKLMREKKVIKAQQRLKMIEANKKADLFNESQEVDETPTTPRKTTNYKKIQLDEEELAIMMENIAVKSIETYKSRKNKKKQDAELLRVQEIKDAELLQEKELKKQNNPLNSIIHQNHSNNLDSLFSDFF
tara:strand:+ start:3304 stop:3984 length:681 start_codon:yes stop_codon:yes gene_type:complete